MALNLRQGKMTWDVQNSLSVWKASLDFEPSMKGTKSGRKPLTHRNARARKRGHSGKSEFIGAWKDKNVFGVETDLAELD